MSDPHSGNVPIIGEAPSFLAMLEHVSRAAELNKPVLVIGERGTGKELIASRLHYLSPRWEQPLVKLNCAALPETILETELFGHVAGAFTGATRDHAGRFERADGGTLVLDELGTIPLRMQEKILRVIEYGEFERVGGSATVNVDVRIIGATNENLLSLAQSGRFRPDLLDRLAFDVITIPPLRARQEDILPLAQAFAINITSELGRPFFPGFSVRAQSELLAYAWPGNVRELKNVVERSVYRSDSKGAMIKRLVLDPFDSPYAPAQAPAADQTREATSKKDQPVPASPPRQTKLPMDLKAQIARFEVSAVEQAMEASQFNQRSAAEALGLSYNQFRGLLRKHGLVKRFGRDRGHH